MKLYERDVDFVNNVTIACRMKKMTKIKVVDLLRSYITLWLKTFLFKLIIASKYALKFSFYEIHNFESHKKR